MKENLPFRPVDNSSSTRLQYQLEAEHWRRAYRSNSISERGTSTREISGLIGSLVSLIVFATVVICTGIYWVLKKAFK